MSDAVEVKKNSPLQRTVLKVSLGFLCSAGPDKLEVGRPSTRCSAAKHNLESCIQGKKSQPHISFVHPVKSLIKPDIFPKCCRKEKKSVLGGELTLMKLPITPKEQKHDKLPLAGHKHDIRAYGAPPQLLLNI